MAFIIIIFSALLSFSNSTSVAKIETRASYLKKKGKCFDVIKLLKPNLPSLTRKGRVLLVECYEATENSVEKGRILTLMIAENEKDHWAHVQMGYYHLSKKTEDVKALHSFKNALEVNRMYMSAYDGLLEVYSRSKNTYEARILLKDMLKLFGPKRKVIGKLCQLSSEGGYHDEAQVFCNQAIKVDRRTPANHVYLGLTLMDVGNDQQGEKIIRTAAKQFTDSELAQWTYGAMVESKKNYVLAYKHFKLATKAKDASAKSFNSFANAAFELGYYDESLGAYVQACQRDRKYFHTLKTATQKLRLAYKSKEATRYESAQKKCQL